MRWSDISFSDRTVRQFAGMWIIFFGGLALWHGFVKENIALAIVFAALSVTLGPLGLVKPAWLRPVYVVWMVLAFPVGWLVSHVALAVLFYGVFTPVAFLFKLTRRDVLQRRYAPEAETYWKERAKVTEPKRYFRQY